MSIKTFLYFLLFIGLFTAGPINSGAQNAPITTCGTVTGVVSGTVSVPVTVIGFNNIGAVSLSA